MLFDRDVDGILTLPECSTALHTLGRRISGIIFKSKIKVPTLSPALNPKMSKPGALDYL